jgi:hypothetical protein
MSKVYHILRRMLFAILRPLTNEAKIWRNLTIIIDAFFTFNVYHIFKTMLFTILSGLILESITWCYITILIYTVLFF